MNHFTKHLRLLPLFPLLLLPACSSDEAPQSPEATTRKMTGLEQKFDLYDLNGDGFLTRKELTEGLRTVTTLEITEKKIDTVFAYYDTDKDGRISLHEAQRGNASGPDELLKMLAE
jgi:Ca2+-binding EF-hand superfamily protein